MKILFVAPLDDQANIHNWGAPSLAFVRIVSYLKYHLKDKDIEYIIYDPQIDDYDVHERFKNDTIDIVGMSLLHYTIINTFEFVHKWKKQHPESFVVVGGNEASANYQDIFDKCPVDAAILLEGEIAMLNLVKWKIGEYKLEDIKGIVYRSYAEPLSDDLFWTFWEHVDFRDFRYPDFWQATADLFEHPNWEEIYCIRLTPSSHCLRKCTFCSLSHVRRASCSGNIKPASLRGEHIMALVHRIHKQLPQVRSIYLCNDDIFYPNRQYFENFVELYEKSSYNYRFIVQTSSYAIKETDFELLKRIGCQHISIGVESASLKIQKSLNKPQDMDKIERLIDMANKYDIRMYYLIILMPPESTLEDLWINYDVLNNWIERGVGLSIMAQVYVYRGMPLYEDVRYNFLYQEKKVPGTNLIYKDPYCVLPNDPIARELTKEFIEREWDYVNKAYEKLDNKLQFKGGTSKILLELLGELLFKYDPDEKFRHKK